MKNIGIIAAALLGSTVKGVYEDEVNYITNQYAENPDPNPHEVNRGWDVEKSFPLEPCPKGYENKPKPLSKKQKAKRKIKTP